MRIFYESEAYSHDDILSLLRGQGLIIDDEERARHILENVSYTRLKSYLLALTQEGNPRRFRNGASFEQAYALYGFDRRLRELIFHEMEKIEISIRTRIAYASNGSEKGYWYTNPEHFRSPRRFETLMRHIDSELRRSDNEAVRNFRRKYNNEFPPSWVAFEALSMGTLTRIYEDMGDQQMRERISGYYGLEPQVFTSWTRHLVNVRNSCAHHNRVWNSEPPVKAVIPDKVGHPFPRFVEEDRYHIYMTLCIIKYLQNTIKPTNTFGARLKTLVGNFRMIDPSEMGFPSGWDSIPFWKDQV